MNRRLFFGISAHSLLNELIHAQKSLGFSIAQKPVKPENFHLTLHFLGSTDEVLIPQLIQIAERISVQPFSITLDHFGLFPKAKCAWLGPSTVPAELLKLVESLQSQLRKLGCHIESHTYRPHLTLYRNARQLPDINASPLIFTPEHFGLFESVSTTNGVQYLQLSTHPIQAK